VFWSAQDAAAVADIMKVRDTLRIRLPSWSPTRCRSPSNSTRRPRPRARGGLRLASARNITGKDVTPFLLDHFHRATHGASLIVNEQIIVRNAELAARIAVIDAGAGADDR
jgi:pseudouridine-5'-phosphate glycosidase